MKKNLTSQRANELLAYHRDTGTLTRKVSMSPASRVGEEAGGLDIQSGYVTVFVDGIRYRAHRVIWLMVTGEWPEVHIDHIDNNRSNNRFSNLREATRSQNQQNRKLSSRNTSGLRGVSWCERTKNWRAQICISNKRIFIGSFSDKFEAYAAFLEKQRELHPFAAME